MAKLIQNISTEKITIDINEGTYHLEPGDEIVVNTSKLSPMIGSLVRKQILFVRYIDRYEIEDRLREIQVFNEKSKIKKVKTEVKAEEKVKEEKKEE